MRRNERAGKEKEENGRQGGKANGSHPNKLLSASEVT